MSTRGTAPARYQRVTDDDSVAFGRGERARISVSVPPASSASASRTSTTPSYGATQFASEAASPTLTRPARVAKAAFAPSGVTEALTGGTRAAVVDYASLRVNVNAGGGDDDDDLEFPEYGSTKQTALGRCYKRCNARKLSWQLKAGIATIVITVMLALTGIIGFYVIAPQYVKERIDATSLSFAKITLTSPTQLDGRGDALRDPQYGFTIVAEAILSGLTPVDGTLDAMATTLSFDGKPVATFTLPAIRALAYQDNVIGLAAPVTVVDTVAFTAFGQAVLLQDTVRFSLAGTAAVRTTLAGITYRIGGVPFQKEIVVAGAGGLQRNAVQSFSLTDSNATAAVAELTVVLVNPSIMSIAPLGDFAVQVLYEGVYMGTVLCPNASLVTGNNTLTLRGLLTPARVDTANDLISHYLAGDAVAVTAQGVAVTSSFPLYAPLLPFVSLNTSLAGTSTPLVNAIVVNSMFLQPASLDSVRIDLNATVIVNNPLGPASPLNVRSVAMNVSLVGGGTVVGALTVPPTPVAAVSQHVLQHGDGSPPISTANVTISVSAILSISETAPAFGDFILLFLNNDTVSLGLVSDDDYGMTVQLDSALGNLTVHIPLSATTEVAGFAGFPSVTVRSFAVAGITNEPPAVLVDLDVEIVNPSPASFPLGENTTLGVYVDGFRLGGSTAYNVTLRPGVNSLTLSAALTPPPEALPATSVLFTNYLKGVAGAATVVGESVFISDSLPTPPWLQDAVQNLSLLASVPGASNLTLFAEVTLDALTFNFSAMGDGTPVVAGVVGGNLHMPFSIPVDVVSIDTDLVFADADTGAPMAGVSLFQQHAVFTPVTDAGAAGGNADGDGNSDGDDNAPIVGTLLVYLSDAPLTVYDAALFGAFISRVLNSASAPVLLTGTASPVVQLVIGNISVANVSVNQLIEVPGMRGLSDPPVVVSSVDITNTSSDSAFITVGLNITNPSILTGDLGPVALDLYYGGFRLTSTAVPSLVVRPGANAMSATGVFTLPNATAQPALYDATIAFLSRYLQGVASVVNLGGTVSSSPYPLLAPAFSSLNASASFPGIDEPLVTNGTLYVSIFDGVRPFANGTLFVRNPLSVPLSLVNTSITVWMCLNESDVPPYDCIAPDYGPAIGFFYRGDLSVDPIVIAPHAHVRTRPLNITLLATGDDDLVLFGEIVIAGSATTKVNGTITARIGELQATIAYSQTRVPLTIKDPPAPPALAAPPSTGRLPMRRRR